MMGQSANRLVAILFADVVGYTALMQRNQNEAMTLIQKFEDTVDFCAAAHDGEVVKRYGDGCLIIFDSAVRACRCAIDLQRDFQQAPMVPLRIGIHTGEVIRREQDIFGDGVNIASRIESMATPGAVLLSGSVQMVISNRSDLDSRSLGFYTLKNVNDPVEIFALVNEALPPPNRAINESALSVAKSSSRNRRKVWMGTIAGLLTIALLLVFQKFSQANQSSPISSADQKKRITVLDFTNQTMTPDLEVYGSMIADWLTRGLLETGEANVLSAENLEQKIDAADLGSDANPTFAQETGIDLMLSGRYYLSENTLIVVAEIIDVITGEILHTRKIQSAKENSVELLNQLTQEIVSYWAVKENVQLKLKPPKYDAYQAWLEGVRLYTLSAKESAEKMESAFRLDTNFYDPLFRLVGIYSNLANFERVNEIMQFLDSRHDQFSKFERLSYRVLQSNRAFDYLSSAQASEEIFAMDPSDLKSNYNAAYFYYLSNRPRNSLEALKRLDPRLLDSTDFSVSWRLSLEAVCHQRLKQYDQVLEVIEAYPFERNSTILAVHHLQALVRLDSMNLLKNTLANYIREGIYAPGGVLDRPDHLLIIICNELLLADKSDHLPYYIDLLEYQITEGLPPFDHSAPDVFNNRPFRKQELEGFVAFYQGDFEQASRHWQAEEIPGTNWPDRLDQASRLGVCAALMNDTSLAFSQVGMINSFKVDHLHFSSLQTYLQARIFAALGLANRAVDQINKALDQGFITHRPYVITGDPFLKSLQNYEPFEVIAHPQE